MTSTPTQATRKRVLETHRAQGDVQLSNLQTQLRKVGNELESKKHELTECRRQRQELQNRINQQRVVSSRIQRDTHYGLKDEISKLKTEERQLTQTVHAITIKHKLLSDQIRKEVTQLHQHTEELLALLQEEAGASQSDHLEQLIQVLDADLHTIRHKFGDWLPPPKTESNKLASSSSSSSLTRSEQGQSALDTPFATLDTTPFDTSRPSNSKPSIKSASALKQKRSSSIPGLEFSPLYLDTNDTDTGDTDEKSTPSRRRIGTQPVRDTIDLSNATPWDKAPTTSKREPLPYRLGPMRKKEEQNEDEEAEVVEIQPKRRRKTWGRKILPRDDNADIVFADPLTVPAAHLVALDPHIAVAFNPWFKHLFEFFGKLAEMLGPWLIEQAKSLREKVAAPLALLWTMDTQNPFLELDIDLTPTNFDSNWTKYVTFKGQGLAESAKTELEMACHGLGIQFRWLDLFCSKTIAPLFLQLVQSQAKFNSSKSNLRIITERDLTRHSALLNQFKFGNYLLPSRSFPILEIRK